MLKLWVERHTAQQCLNQKRFGLGGCLHPKPNPCLMRSHSKRLPLMLPHGDKVFLPPVCNSNQQLLSYHCTVIPAKAEDFYLFGMRVDSLSSSTQTEHVPLETWML